MLYGWCTDDTHARDRLSVSPDVGPLCHFEAVQTRSALGDYQRVQNAAQTKLMSADESLKMVSFLIDEVQRRFEMRQGTIPK